MDGKRILPAITDEMMDGFMRSQIFINEVNSLVIDGVKLGDDCALPNCHSVVRVASKFFQEFDLVDGFIPILKSKIQDGKLCDFKISPMHHSWLALKSNSRFILDIMPIGAVPPFIVPLFLYLDEYSPDYVSGGLPENVSLDEINKDADAMFKALAKSFGKKIETQNQNQSAP